MKRRAAIIQVNFEALAYLLFPEGQLHLARPSFTAAGQQVFDLYITHPSLPEIEEGDLAPTKMAAIQQEIKDGRIVTKLEFV